MALLEVWNLRNIWNFLLGWTGSKFKELVTVSACAMHFNRHPIVRLLWVSMQIHLEHCSVWISLGLTDGHGCADSQQADVAFVSERIRCLHWMIPGSDLWFLTSFPGSCSSRTLNWGAGRAMSVVELASVADMDVYLGHRADPMLGRWILAGPSFYSAETTNGTVVLV
jgi:hypothetical protein